MCFFKLPNGKSKCIFSNFLRWLQQPLFSITATKAPWTKFTFYCKITLEICGISNICYSQHKHLWKRIELKRGRSTTQIESSPLATFLNSIILRVAYSVQMLTSLIKLTPQTALTRHFISCYVLCYCA